MKRIATIALLDDDEGVRDLYYELLSDIGNVIVAKDSDELYEKIKKSLNVDLFVIDNKIKNDKRFDVETTGLSVLKTIRNAYSSTVPIIIVTGYSLSEKQIELINQLDAFYLKKPLISNSCLINLSKDLISEYSSVNEFLKRDQIIRADFEKGTEKPLFIGEKYHLNIDLIYDRIDKREKNKFCFNYIIPEIIIRIKGDDLDINPCVSTLQLTLKEPKQKQTICIIPKEAAIEDKLRKVTINVFYCSSLIKEMVLSFPIENKENNYKLAPIDDPQEVVKIRDTQKPIFGINISRTKSDTITADFVKNQRIYKNAIADLKPKEWEELNLALRSQLEEISKTGTKYVQRTGKNFDDEVLKKMILPLLEVSEYAFNKIFPNIADRSYIISLVDESIDLFGITPIIEINSDSFLIPWDLLFFPNKETPTRQTISDFGNLWGMKAIVSKALPVSGPIQDVKNQIDNLNGLKTTLIWDSTFYSVERHELSLLSKIKKRIRLKVIKDPENFNDIHEVLNSEQHIFHMACHSEVTEEITKSHFKFKNYKLSLIKLEHPDIRFSYPSLFVISSCGNLKFDANSRTNILQTLVNKGACGVLGTEVSVFSPFASRFISKVYYAVIKGKTIGESVLYARKRCWQKGGCNSPFGMIYSFYGNSNIRLSNPIENVPLPVQCDSLECCKPTREVL